MRVLLASAEAAPFAKVGGLADVVGSLPAALRERDIDARVILPGYGFISHLAYDIQPILTFGFSHQLGWDNITIYGCEQDGIPFYLLQAPPYFGIESEVYSHWRWDMRRYVYFSQALMAAIWQLEAQLEWRTDVAHLNDWHTGLLSFLIREHGAHELWSSMATVMSIHNIAYQGAYAGEFLAQASIAARAHSSLLNYGLADNLLAIGIAYADMISTVSPRYADEIRYSYAGYDLAPLISERAEDLRGILNGLDTALWDPATDADIATNFDATEFEDKRPLNKAHLQSLAGLPLDASIPLIGIVSRLAAQKGFDMAIPALRQILASRPAQVVVLGSGESEIEVAFWQLEQDFPGQVRAFLQFDGALARRIYAGCDIFLMPSHFEPCGMGQMIAMRYGALPLARETGGLADTVVNYDNGAADAGTGFLFQWQEAAAVAGTLNWALDVYADNREAWTRMQRRGMRRDFSWHKSAGETIDLYEAALDKAKRRGSVP